MAKYQSKAHYLGEPSHLILKAIVENSLSLREIAGIISSRAEVCPPAPEPDYNPFATKDYVCESVSLYQSPYGSASPRLSSCSPKQGSMRYRKLSSSRNPKLKKGDMDEIISFILSSP